MLDARFRLYRSEDMTTATVETEDLSHLIRRNIMSEHDLTEQVTPLNQTQIDQFSSTAGKRFSREE